ncbi:MAG: hypothetical protein AB8F74_00565 [Saprospiraceae bacterium]
MIADKKKVVKVGNDKHFVSLLFPYLSIPVKVCHNYYKRLIESNKYDIVDA